MPKGENKSDLTTQLSQNGKKIAIELNKAPIVWDLENSKLSFFGIDSALFWTDPSLVRMLLPLSQEIGSDLFRLLIAYSSSLGTKEDYHTIISTLGNTFEEGFLAWGKSVSTAGWGVFEIPELNLEEKKATVIIHNSWEISMQRNLSPDERWGCPFLLGKIIGIFNHAFNTKCWAKDYCHYDHVDAYVELKVFPSQKTIQNEIKKLRFQRMVASEKKLAEKVEEKTAELHQSQQEVENYSKTLEQKVAERTAELLKANKRLQNEIINRKKAEDILKQNHETLDHILAASQVGIGLVENRLITWVNEECISMFKAKSKEAFYGKNTAEFYANENDYHDIGRRVYNRLKSGKPVEIEAIFKRKDGSVFPAQIKMSTHNPSNPMESTVFTISDMTLWKKAEDRLRKSEERYRAILDSMIDEVYICSPEFRLEYMNPAMRKRLGRDAIGDYCHKAIYNRDEICSWCVLNKVITNETTNYELQNSHNGRDYLITNIPILDDKGKISKLTIARDVTDHKQYEKTLKEEKERLEHALNEIQTLSGLLPICAKCKKIRDDKGYWNNLEVYLEKHTDASFSHGICQECSEELYGHQDWYIKMKKKKGLE